MGLEVGILVGNPKPKSRTRVLAERLGNEIIIAVGQPGLDSVRVFELSDLAAEMFNFSSDTLNEVIQEVCCTSLIVVASPIYKGSYTGLLKAFFDRFSPNNLLGKVVIPVMLGASLAHAQAVQYHLQPLLMELGAIVPVRGLYVLEDQLDRSPEIIKKWLYLWSPVLGAALGVR